MWKRRFLASAVAVVIFSTYPMVNWWLHVSEFVEAMPAIQSPPRPMAMRHTVGTRPPRPKTLADWPSEPAITADTAGRGCAPRMSVVYVKTHKTASSTLQNIVYRWGERHNLTFALPTSGVQIRYPLTRKQLVPSPSGTYNILANHARFEPEAFHEIMSPDAVYITILRDPQKQFESYYNYFHCHAYSVYGASLPRFLTDPQRYLDFASYTNRRNAMCIDAVRNPQLFDLGFNSVLRGKNSPAMASTMDEWIDVLKSSFHLVLIADYFLESMVVLRDALCWDVDDVVVLDVNRRLSIPTLPATSDLRNGTAALSELIARWNAGDVKLYRHFNRTLWRRLDVIGRFAVAREIAAIQERTIELVNRCIENIEWLSRTEYRTKTMYQTPLKNIVGRYTLKQSASNDPLCQRLVLPAPNYLDFLRQKMKGEI